MIILQQGKLNYLFIKKRDNFKLLNLIIGINNERVTIPSSIIIDLINSNDEDDCIEVTIPSSSDNIFNNIIEQKYCK